MALVCPKCWLYPQPNLKKRYLFSAFKESRGQALRDPLEHYFVLKISHFWGQVGPGRASPHATCKALNRYKKRMLNLSWDSPRNLHFGLPKLVLAREKSMYLDLVPSEGQSQCRTTISAFIAKLLFFVTVKNE